VVVPFHNQHSTIAECLKSVLESEVPITQVLVLDDASRNTIILREDLPNDRRLHIARFKKNMGVQAVRNLGWKMLRDRCHYLLFCDGDIVWEPEGLKYLWLAMEEERDPEIAYAYGDYNRIGGVEGVWQSREFDGGMLRMCNYISTMSLVKTTCLPNPPFVEDEKRLQDWSLWLRMMNNGFKGKYVNKTIFTATYPPGCVSLKGQLDYQYWSDLVRGRYVTST
jgi:glycosyltransferase involved in cell wall biosynthesis